MSVDWFNQDNLPWTCDLDPVVSNVVSAERRYNLNCREGDELNIFSEAF